MAWCVVRHRDNFSFYLVPLIVSTALIIVCYSCKNVDEVEERSTKLVAVSNGTEFKF